ncbi:MAG: hypothetical protein MUO76_16285 [Anaerolineaceae bacterium]|nr:hypothetical protein [Anaerolineaceae bacterium]
MVASDERLKVLSMVQEGKITAEEAVQLLEALDDSAAEQRSKPRHTPPSPSIPGRAGRWLQMRVTDTDTGKIRVNVRLPIGVVKAGLKMGMRFVPEAEGLDKEELIAAIEKGTVGSIFDMFDEKDGEHIEVIIE